MTTSRYPAARTRSRSRSTDAGASDARTTQCERSDVGPSVPGRDPNDAAAITERLRLHVMRQRSESGPLTRDVDRLATGAGWLASADAPGRDRSAVRGARSRSRTRRAARAPAGGARRPARRRHRRRDPSAPRAHGDARRAGAGAPRRLPRQLEAFCRRGGGRLDPDTSVSDVLVGHRVRWPPARGSRPIDALERRRRRPPRSVRSARPATTPSPVTRWASACSTTSRSPRRRSRDRGERVADRRLGRASRQRHAGHVLRRPRRHVRVAARVAALPRHGPPRRGRASAPARARP